MTTTDPVTSKQRARPALVGWSLAGLLAVIVVTGVLAGVLRETPTLDSGSPGGVVQAYAQAVIGDRYVAARELLTDDLQTHCTAVDFRDAWLADPTTITLADTTVTGDTAVVTIDLRTLAGPEPFGTTSRVRTEELELVRAGDTWRITGAPWPVYDCGR